LEKITLDFEEGKGTRDATGMHRVISEGNLDIDEEFCACSISGRRHWTCKLDQIVLIMIETGMDWQQRIFIRK